MLPRLFCFPFLEGLFMNATATESQVPISQDWLAPRRAAIQRAIGDCEAARLAWVATPGDEPAGPPVLQGFCGLVTTFANGPIPDEFQPVVQCIEQIGGVLIYQIQSPKFSFQEYEPNSAIFSPYENMQAKLTRQSQPLSRLETLRELIDQKVPVEQIAKMHGLTPSDVQKEISEPGSIETADYVPPIFEKRRAELLAGDDFSDGMVLSATARKLKALMAVTFQ
jgi:hypothetical protein